MDLLTFYSDSHKEIYEDYFLKSFNEHLSESFDLKVKKIEQLSPNGDYDSSGFMETMMDKLKLILEHLHVGTDPFVFADCDIQFFRDFKEDILRELGGNDIRFQDDIVCRCAGFFVAKRNDEVKRFFDIVYKETPKYFQQQSDQTAINVILNSQQNFGLKLNERVLPRNKYFTVAASTNAKQWAGQDFNIPTTLVAHHANWTVGLDNKIKLLQFVKNKFRK